MRKSGRRTTVAATLAILAAMALPEPAISSISAPESQAQPAMGSVAQPVDQQRGTTQAPLLLAFSDSTTNNVVRSLQQGEAECGRLPAEYRADCMSQAYRDASRAANRPDYQLARTELSRTSRSLSSLVQQNVDPAAQPIRQGFKSYRAVKKSAVATVNSQARAIIQETETKLLRSATSGLRKTHYSRIAQAVGSTKKIFRS